MRCDEAERLSQERLDGPLSTDDGSALETHLCECAPCARYARELARITEGLGDLEGPAGGDAAWERAVQAALRPRRKSPVVWASLAAAAVLVAMAWLATARWARMPGTVTSVVTTGRELLRREAPVPPTPLRTPVASVDDLELPEPRGVLAVEAKPPQRTHRPRRQRAPRPRLVADAEQPAPEAPSPVEEEQPPPPGPVPYAPEELHTVPTSQLVAEAEGALPTEAELVRVAMLSVADVPPEAMLSPRRLLQLSGNPLDPPPEIASAVNIEEE